MALRTPPVAGNEPRFGYPDASLRGSFMPVVHGAPPAAADLAELARLTRVAQAGRELAHTVNNLLSLPLGVLELLEAQAGVPADLHSLVTAAREALASAAIQAQEYQALASPATLAVDAPPR
jgi:hypothetical protein